MIELKKKLVETLDCMLSIYDKHSFLDLRTAVTTTGPGTSTSHLQPYFGPYSWIEFRKSLSSDTSFQELHDELCRAFPDLLGYVRLFHSSTQLPDFMPYLTRLMTHVESQSAILPRSKRVKKSVKVLCDALEKRELLLEVDCQFNGSVLGEGTINFALEPHVRFIRLSTNEMEQMLSSDISLPKFRSPWQRMSDSVLRITFSEPFEIGKESEVLGRTGSRQLTVLSVREDILHALHLFKPGRAGYIQVEHRYLPELVPFVTGFTTYPPPSALPGTIRIESDEVVEFKKLYMKVKTETRRGLRLAILKLSEAEQRDSSIDALVDCIVGLEALLKPNAQGEQAFRVALNYAFLFPKRERRERFDEISQAQSLRNSVIHGSASVKDLDSLQPTSIRIKNALREVCKMAIYDRNFGGTKSDSRDYWITRILGAKT